MHALLYVSLFLFLGKLPLIVIVWLTFLHSMLREFYCIWQLLHFFLVLDRVSFLVIPLDRLTHFEFGSMLHTFFARSSLTHFVLLDRPTHFAGLRSVQRSSLAWVMLGSSYSVYKLPARLRFLHSRRCKAES